MGVLSTLLSIVPRRRELPAAPAAVVLPVGPALPARREGVRGALARKRPARSKRYYTAGNNAEFLSWNPGMVSADSAIYQNLNLMKARARDLARNNDYVVQFLRLLKANVIGPAGVRFRSQLRGPDGALDKVFNSEFEKLRLSSGRLKNGPSVDAMLSRTDYGNLWIRNLAVDGEVIEVEHPGHRGNKFGYACQMVDSALLDYQLNSVLGNGNAIKMGVEKTPEGRPVAYYFLQRLDGDYLWNAPQGFGGAGSLERGQHVRIPAERCRHSFLVETPGQTRGVTWLASPSVRAQMLQKFEEAIVIGSRAAASKMGFYKTSEEFAGAAPGDAGEGEDEEVDAILRTEVEPGMIDQLPRGIDFEPFDPGYPPNNLDEFTKSILRGIASGLGGEYVGISNNLEGVNYSSIRAGKLDQRDIWRTLTAFYCEHCEERDFERWARMVVINPRFSIDSRKIERVLDEEAFRFQGRGWAWVDPLKEGQAHLLAIENRLTSRRRVYEETTNGDYEDLLREIEEEESQLSELGLLPAAAAAPGGLAPDDEEGEEGSADEEVAE